MLSKIIHIIPLIIFTTLATCKIEAGWLDSFDIFAKKSHQISLECDRKLNDFRKKSMTNIGKTLLGAIWSSIKKEEPSTEDGLDNLFEKEEIKDVDACEKTIKEQQKKLDLLKQKTLPQTKKDLKMGIGEFRTKVIKPTISKWEKKKKDGEPEQQLEAVLSQIDSSPQLESVVEIASTFGEQIQKKIKIKKTIKCLKKLIEIYKSIKKTTQETDEFLKANQDLETRFKASRKEYKERLIHAADTAKKGKGKALTKKTEATDNLVKNVYYQNYLLKDGDLKNTKQSHEAAKQKLDSIDKKQNPIGYGLAKQEALRAQSKLKKCKSELEEIFHKFSREHSQYNQASQNLDQADKLLKSQEKNRDAYDEKKLSKEEYVSRTIYGYARRWKTIGWTIGVGTSIILYSNIRNYISEYKKHIESNNKKKKKSQEAPLRAGQHVRRFFKQFRFAPISIKHLVGLMAIGAGTTMLAFRGLEKIAENSVTTAS